MRLSLARLFAVLGLCTLATAPHSALASPVSGRTLTQLSPTAARPQARAISKAICATASFSTQFMVAVQVLFIRLEIPMTIYYDDVGLCATADSELTDATISTLNAELAATLPGLLDGLRLINSVDVLSLQAQSQLNALRVLESLSTICDYPAFAVPESADNCDLFTCKTGYNRCNGLCVPIGQPCTSPGVRKRSLATRSKYICPLDEVACPVLRGTTKVDAVLDLKNVDCVAVRHKLDSCGGCISPFPGKPKGQDCTQIPDVWDVSCVAGGCVVETCSPGFVPTDDKAGCKRLQPGQTSGSTRRCLPGHCKRRSGASVALSSASRF